MENQITILSKTQMIVIEPNSQSVSVVDAGPIGPIDPDETGTPGEDAKNAFELAQDHGFVGTLTQWLASLEGDETPADMVPTAVGGIDVEDLPQPITAIGGVNVTDL